MFVLFGVVFTISMAVMGRSVSEYVPGFVILFLGSLALMYLSGWTVLKRYDLGAPLLALVIGLVIGNLVKMPDWFKTALRTEYYIKTGIVLLGATLPLTLIFTAGPIAFLQATIVSVCTWLTIYLAATRLFKLEPQFGAVLGAGGAVCGVSASIAVGGAVKAKKDHIAIGIAVVSVWAIVMILVLTIGLKFLVPDVVSPGRGRAPGSAPRSSPTPRASRWSPRSPTRHGDSAINTFTLMKVIGRDIWIGIWCLDPLDRLRHRLGARRGPGGGRVGRRHLAALPQVRPRLLRRVGDHEPGGGARARGPRRPGRDRRHLQEQRGDDRLRRRLLRLSCPPARWRTDSSYDPSAGVITFQGRMSPEEYVVLRDAIDPGRPEPQRQDRRPQAASLQVRLVREHTSPRTSSRPIKKLRSWAFVICFLGIGLSTRFAELATFGLRPFWAFTIGVVVNVPLGYVLSTIVFSDYWSRI